MQNKSNIFLVGDIALDGLYLSDKKHNLNRFKEVLHLFNNNDITIANLETPIANGNELNPNKSIHFYSEEDVVREILPLLNIKVVSLANNHIGDYGIPGINKTIEVLEELNIYHTGAGIKKSHIEPSIFEVNSKKIAFLAYVDKNTNPKLEGIDKILINYFDEYDVINKINEIKNTVDKIILSLHWGIDYSFYPTQYQVEIARKLVDLGVDIIVGHHTHTFQPFEKYKHGFIFYGLGGLTFGDYYQNEVMKALPIKTKFSGIPIFSFTNNFHFKKIISVNELIGNYLITTKKNLIKWSNRKWIIYRLKKKNYFIRKIVNIKEDYIDRIYEFLFGYYKSPLKRVVKLIDPIRIRRLFNDSKIKNNRIL